MGTGRPWRDSLGTLRCLAWCAPVSWGCSANGILVEVCGKLFPARPLFCASDPRGGVDKMLTGDIFSRDRETQTLTCEYLGWDPATQMSTAEELRPTHIHRQDKTMLPTTANVGRNGRPTIWSKSYTSGPSCRASAEDARNFPKTFKVDQARPEWAEIGRSWPRSPKFGDVARHWPKPPELGSTLSEIV